MTQIEKVYFVLSETQMSFVRSERDYEGFARSSRRKVNALVDLVEAPKVYEDLVLEDGRKVILALHAETKMLMDVQDA